MADKTNPLPRAAANGLLDRRFFLRSAAAGATAALTAPKLLAQAVGEGQPESILKPGYSSEDYGTPARYEIERGVHRTTFPVAKGRTMKPGGLTPHHLLRGTITPSGLHFELNHQGIPDIHPEQHELVIHGMVRRPMKYTVDALENYAMVTRQHVLECAGNGSVLWADKPAPDVTLDKTHGLMSASEWTGVPLATLLDECGADKKARWLVVEGGDSGAMTRSVPISKAFDDSLIAIYQNGERLRPGNGYPMRLFNPGYEGNTNVKWVRSIHVTDRPVMSRFETSKYTDLMANGKALQFTLEMDVKSVITRPSNAMSLPKHGIYEVTGVAWSGGGRIARVEVSADGGKTWAEAEMEEPVQSRMLTRFRIPWEWRGAAATLQSRAWDETGRRQPTRRELVAARGRNGHYHYNAIHSWQVDKTGGIKHVYA
jgi:sulfane dehydrogenase subunit SoxC